MNPQQLSQGGLNLGQQQPQPQLQSTQPHVQAPQQPTANNEAPAPPSAPLDQQPCDERNESEGTLNPNAFRSVDNEKQSAFDDAFGGLSLEPTPSAYHHAGDGAAAPPTQTLDIPYTAPYREGQQLLYRNSSGSCMVTVKKVHFDDELTPYYTVDLEGREKQTDNTHLSLPPNSMENDTSILLRETVSMLQKLDPQQLVQVSQLIASIASGNTSNNQATGPAGHISKHTNVPAPSPPGAVSSATPQPATPAPVAPAQFPMQQQYGGIPQPSTEMGAPPPPSAMPPPSYGMPQQATGTGIGVQGVSAPAMSPSAPAPAQTSLQQHQSQPSILMGMDAPPAAPSLAMPPPAHAPAPTQFSVPQQPQLHQGMPQQQSMGMSAPAQTLPAIAPTPAQFSMQQPSPTRGMPQQQQPMGMGVPSLTPPTAMPPPPPGQAPVQFSMQEQQPPHGMPQQQPMGMEMNSPAAAPPAPALSTVEKEGNPFDFY